MYKALEKFVKANDDWYPSCEGNMVKVTGSAVHITKLLKMVLFPGGVKIFVAGIDDDVIGLNGLPITPVRKTSISCGRL